MTILLDAAPIAGGIAIVAAVAFLFVFLAAAFIAFKMLKKTAKLAVRVVIVAIILAVAIAGSVFLFAVGSSKPARPTPRPVPTR